MCEGDIKSFKYITGQKGSYNNIPLGFDQSGSKSIIPSVDDSSSIVTGNYTFTEEDFTKNFITSDGSKVSSVRISSLPQEGNLKFDAAYIDVDFEFNIEDSNKLIYELTNELNFSIQTFTFQTSNNNLNKYFSKMATFTFNIDAYVNLPPTAVGDNSLTINNASTHTFTVADFTTTTTPAYSDPEGDDPAELKVLTLPDDGSLQFNGIDVVINQIIPFDGVTSIDSGALKYIASQTNENSDIEAFTFQISDSGSNIFVG